MYAADCENIVITGKGTIDGNGRAWWKKFAQIEREDRTWPQESYELRLAKLNPDYKERTGGGARPSTQFLRPPLIQFWKCKNIIFENFTLQNSPFWTLHTVYCENITIQGMTIANPQMPLIQTLLILIPAEMFLYRTVFLMWGMMLSL